jgi:hypothetical protein
VEDQLVDKDWGEARDKVRAALLAKDPEKHDNKEETNNEKPKVNLKQDTGSRSKPLPISVDNISKLPPPLATAK